MAPRRRVSRARALAAGVGTAPAYAVTRSAIPREPAPWVLLVEDDEAVASALQFALTIEGWRVDVRTSGEALLAAPVPAGSVCLVIDVQLPGISGLAALAELRRRGSRTPAILITSDPPPATVRQAARLGARIVEKPLIGGELLDAIRAHLA